jgi:acyl-CoA thioester hydrolase
MGYVYYGNYAQYFEVARVEALRALGLSYKLLEDSGTMLPVREFKISYYKPAHYDDLLTIETLITELPTAKLKFEFTTFNEKKELLNKGWVDLVFVNIEKNRPTKAPDYFLEALLPFFKLEK